MKVLEALPVHLLLFVDNPEFVILLQPEKVNGPAEDLRQNDRQLRVRPPVLHRHPQGGLHPPPRLLAHPFHRILPAGNVILLVAQVEQDIGFGILLIHEKRHPGNGVPRGEDGVRLPFPDFFHIEYPFGCLAQPVDLP